MFTIQGIINGMLCPVRPPVRFAGPHSTSCIMILIMLLFMLLLANNIFNWWTVWLIESVYANPAWSFAYIWNGVFLMGDICHFVGIPIMTSSFINWTLHLHLFHNVLMFFLVHVCIVVLSFSCGHFVPTHFAFLCDVTIFSVLLLQCTYVVHNFRYTCLSVFYLWFALYFAFFASFS